LNEIVHSHGNAPNMEEYLMLVSNVCSVSALLNFTGSGVVGHLNQNVKVTRIVTVEIILKDASVSMEIVERIGSMNVTQVKTVKKWKNARA